MVKFQYYPANIFAKEPLGEVTLTQFINSIRNPKPQIKELLEEISKEEDKKKRDALKTKLFMFTPNAIFDGVNRGYDNIVDFTELLTIEWDNLKIEQAIYLKHHIFNSFSSCICAFLSPSKKGVKFLFKTEKPKSIEDYKSLWWGLAYHLEEIFPDVDPANERCSQVLFLSHDSEILVREEPTVWTKRGGKHCSVVVNTEFERTGEPTEESTQSCKDKILKIIDNFEGDNGHKLVLSVSTIMGGFIAGGEIEFDEAQDFIFNEIDNHYYLKTKASTYKKTATRFLISGQNAPLTFSKNE